jgi:hypothetical protein
LRVLQVERELYAISRTCTRTAVLLVDMAGAGKRRAEKKEMKTAVKAE